MPRFYELSEARNVVPNFFVDTLLFLMGCRNEELGRQVGFSLRGWRWTAADAAIAEKNLVQVFGHTVFDAFEIRLRHRWRRGLKHFVVLGSELLHQILHKHALLLSTLLVDSVLSCVYLRVHEAVMLKKS